MRVNETESCGTKIMECKNKIIHTIAEGDTLYKLSKQYDTTVTELIMGNPTANPYNLRVGARIQVCPGEKYYAVMEKPGMPAENRPGNRPAGMPPQDGNTGTGTPSENAGAVEQLLWSMRLAWLSQIYWIRMYMMSVAAGAADAAETEERMLETVDEITDVFASILPVQSVRRLREMLMRQTELVAAGIRAEKAGETFDYSIADDNAVAIAQFFADLNPYFGKQETENQLLNYLDLIRRQSTEQMDGEFGRSIDTFRDLDSEAIQMADYFARGLLAR